MNAHSQTNWPVDTELLSSWVSRIKVGDETAAEELVRYYEPEIRRFIRVRLTDARLRRVLDSVDVCQSVMAKFFCYVQTDRLTFEHPLQLLKLLITMARNSLLDHLRKADVRRMALGTASDYEMTLLVDPQLGQADLAERADLVGLIRAQLRPIDQHVLDRWLLGCGWEEISQELGYGPDALRKRLSRALDRATEQLGLMGDKNV